LEVVLAGLAPLALALAVTSLVLAGPALQWVALVSSKRTGCMSRDRSTALLSRRTPQTTWQQRSSTGLVRCKQGLVLALTSVLQRQR